MTTIVTPVPHRDEGQMLGKLLPELSVIATLLPLTLSKLLKTVQVCKYNACPMRLLLASQAATKTALVPIRL